MSSPSTTRPRVRNVLLAQLAEGFGGRFHGVLLGLYAYHLAGLEGFAGFAAAAMLGSGLSAVAAGWLTARFGGAAAMRVSAGTLVATRLACYALIPFGLPLVGLMGLRLLGAVSGTMLNTAAKTQVPEGDRATVSLAWMNVANGGGQASAALAAGLLSTASPLTIALLGAPIAVAATVPLLRLARFSVAAPVPLREQVQGLRQALAPVLVGAGVFLVLNALPNLADGLTTELYSAGWLGPLSVVAFGGSVLAATVLPRLTRSSLWRAPDPVLWTGLGAIGVVGWALADRGIGWLILAQFAAAFVAQTLAAMVETRVMERTGRARALPALSASGAVAAFGGATVSGTVPSILDRVGFAGTATWSVVALIVLAVTATVAGRVREARADRTAVAPTG